MKLGPIVYKTLFGEDIEILPDPNKPENQPRLKAMRQSHDEKFKRFWEGSGSVLFDRWQGRIRGGVFDLLVAESNCNCESCIKIREMQTIVKLLAEAQFILDKE